MVPGGSSRSRAIRPRITLVSSLVSLTMLGGVTMGCVDQGLAPRAVPELTLTVSDTLIEVGGFARVVSSKGGFDTTWRSSDNSVATVSDVGVVRGWAVGRVLITADWSDPKCRSGCGALHAQVWITVVAAAP